MKHTKKLIPALGMLLLSACMLVTSTFAWFSMNDTVKATNMAVTARGNQVYLQIISGDDPADFDDGAAQIVAEAEKTWGNAEDSILPTNVKSFEGNTYSAYNGGKNFKWVTAIGKNPSANYEDAAGNKYNDGYAPVDGKYSEIPSTTGYYLENSFMIRLDATAGATAASGPLKSSSVAFTDTHATDDLRKAVCVLVVCGDYSQLWAYDTTDSQFEMVAKSNKYLNTTDDAKENFANTTGVEVKVYVFFNGDSEYCTLENLAKAKSDAKYNTYSVEVTFDCAEIDKNS